MRRLAYIIAVAVFAPYGCVARDVGYQDVRQLTAERIGRDVRWREIDGSSVAAKRTAVLVAKPLTADAAVEVALLNNRGLQAAFEDLGVARADIVRALGLPNPSAEAAVLFHSTPTRPELQFRALEDLSELIALPLRTGAAQAGLDAAKAAVAGRVLDLAFETRAAAYEHQAALQLLELRRTVLLATRASFEAAQRLHDAGNITDLSLANERALFEESRVGHARAEAEAAGTRERLGALLGLTGPLASWQISAHLPDLPSSEIPVDTIERLSIEKSLDLAMTRHRFEAAAKRANFSRVRGWLPGLSVGAALERREQWGIGPAAAISLPLFYQGQGEVGAALSDMRRERELFADTAARVRAAARAVTGKLTTMRASVIYYRDVLLPLRNEIVDGTQLEYNAMTLGVFQLLQAKRDQIETGRQYVEGLRDYWLARSQAEELLAGHLGVGMPAMAPAKDAMISKSASDRGD